MLMKYSRGLKFACVAGCMAVGLFAVGAMSALSADTPDPTAGETARLLGYLWADGSFSDGVWDATAPSGGAPLIDELVERHGGEWVDRQQLQFRLPAPYDWVDWKDSIPNDDERVYDAVQNPHFLAAVLEGEGAIGGLVYDQSSCCTDGFTEGRLTSLLALLHELGLETATIDYFGDVDSGRVTIAPSEFGELRSNHQFVCPVQQNFIRVPGGDNFADYGNLRWLGQGTEFGDFVRNDCVEGQSFGLAQAPVGTCTATVDGDEVTVSWSQEIGTVSLRRDGRFTSFAAAGDGSTVDTPGEGTFSYAVLLRVFNDSTTAQCGSVTVGGAPERTVGEPAAPVPPAPAEEPDVQPTPEQSAPEPETVVEADPVAQPEPPVEADPVAEPEPPVAAPTPAEQPPAEPVVETPATPVAPAAPPAVASSCTVQPAGTSVLLEWEDEGVDRYQVRRNRGWVSAFSAQFSAIQSGTIDDGWLIRFIRDGEVVDMACAVDETPAAIPCSLVARDGGVAISWEAVDGIERYQVRQNGSWIAATAGAGFFHAGASEVAAYNIRYRPPGQVVTLECAPA